jgi:hypothetical protein
LLYPAELPEHVNESIQLPVPPKLKA